MVNSNGLNYIFIVFFWFKVLIFLLFLEKIESQRFLDDLTI